MTYMVITGTLTARTAFHIGRGEDSSLTDALVRRGADEQPFIPGTAIAGVLRSLLTRLAPRLGKSCCKVLATESDERGKTCDCAVCRLFGDINPTDEIGSTSAASCLLVFNARSAGTMPCPLIRDGVGINRVTGAAAEAVKFDLEVVPAGAVFELRIELRNAGTEDELLLAAGLAEWSEGRLWLGGHVGRGLGGFTLNDLQFKTLCLDTPAQVLAFLQEDEPWQQAQPIDGWLEEQLRCISCVSAGDKPKAVARGWLSLTGTLQAEGPLLTNDNLTAGASGFDHAPLLEQWNEWGKPVLTGAGLRGALRSHAERLVRTLAAQQAGKNDFLRCCPACDPNVRDSDNDRRLPLESCDSLLKKYYHKNAGIPGGDEDSSVPLCLACRLFGSPRVGSRLIVEDAVYKQTQEEPRPVFKMMDFLAIDRFTGGGGDGLKFDALALWRPAFAFRLHLDNPEPWELGWLTLVLRDMAEGWLTVGFGSAKGFGRVKFKDCTAVFGYLLPEDAPPGLTELAPADQKYSGVYTAVSVIPTADGCSSLVQKWVDAFHREVRQFQRPEQIELNQDSYFGCVDELYEVVKGGAQ